MTTNTTNSPDIHDLLCDLFEAGFDSPSRHESTADYRKARDAILAHIDAKLAQAREEGPCSSHEANMPIPDHNKWRKACKEIIDKCVAPALYSDAMEMLTQAYNSAGHTEPQTRIRELLVRLAEIQRGVEGLERASPVLDQVLEVVGMQSNPGGSWINRRQVLALLQPQGQADTSGLPG